VRWVALLVIATGVPPVAPHFRVTKPGVALPRLCRPAPVVRRVVSILTAFDAGHGDAFARGFTRRGDLAPYGGTPEYAGRAAIARFAVSRHRAGDGWSATILHPPLGSAGLPAEAVYELGLTVRYRGRMLEGRGAKLVVDCHSTLIRKWVGPRLALAP
jgi:hypothetical protein